MSKRRNLLDSAEKRRSLQNVAVARGRLKGALADIMTHSDEDTDSDADAHHPTRHHSKRSKIASSSASATAASESIPIPHQSYIMKLFDRSVDLARFDESTPLYPICRAWMQNQPRANPNRMARQAASPLKREHNPEMAEQYRNKELREIRAMPLAEPEAEAIGRCPSPLPGQEQQHREERAKGIDLSAEPVAKATLLQEHKQRWGQVRQKWQDHGKRRDQRYEASFELLDALLKTHA